MPNNTAIVGEEALTRVRDWANGKFVTASRTAIVTIAPSDWANLSCTKAVTDMTPSKVVFISPATTSFPDYIDCGVRCTAQGTGTLSFACNSVPSSSVVVNVLITPNAKDLVSISVSGDWTNDQYTESAIDTTGLTVTALFSDGSTADVTSLTTAYPSSWASAVGTQTAMFYYTYNGVTKTTSKDAEVVSVYQQVEYLEGTGAQYIDTGLLYFADFEVSIQLRNNVTKKVLGVSAYDCMQRVGSSAPYWQFTDGGSSFNSTVRITEKHVMKWKEDKIYADGTFLVDKEKPFTASPSMCLFSADGRNKFPNMIYYCKLWDSDGVLVRDFIPCYRKADNVAGMYDSVNDVFYTNAGTGTFIVGPDVTV